jgi:WD40 repeat protein
VRVWDLTSGRCEHVLTSHYIWVVVVSADGSRAVTISPSEGARVWDLASGRCEHVLTDQTHGMHTGYYPRVMAVAVSADGSRAVTGSGDGTVRVWDLVSGRCEHLLTGHAGSVVAVAVSADGSRAVTGGSADQTVRLWDLISGQQIDQWNCEYDITSLGASLRLLHIAAGDTSGQVHILDLGAS